MKHAMWLALAVALGCGSKADKAPEKAPTPPPVKTEDPPTPPESPKAALTVEGFMTPESVLYDADNDVYLVSNINGGEVDADDNGFISALKPDGTVTRWIDGAAADIKLDGPKGSAIVGGTFYVADISVLRRFDRKTGKQLDDIKIEGATFLNDVVADGAGGVLVTDSGFDAKLQPNGADAVYHVSGAGVVTKRASGKGLGAPNGLAMGEDGTVEVATFGSGEVYAVDVAGKKLPGSMPPKGELDGLVVLEHGDLLVSSWGGKAIYRGKVSGEWKEIVSGVEAPADIGLDTKRKLILVPLFTKNQVKVFALPSL
ncbi:MAG: SMP-30/gluconolactonase/LRE family protein [Myxococcales bacterium]|nr:SMP-30/gluconolactonase/LRE family protein [Myxococcales bacterium]